MKADALNTENAGSGVPVKWNLADADGNSILELAAVVSYGSGVFDCESGVPDTFVVDAERTGNSVLSVGSSGYIFDWDTDKAWAGTCRRLVMALDSGQELTVNFEFK